MANPATIDAYNRLQFNMIHVHSGFKLGFDRILTLLDNPPTQDLRNFLGYCEAWAVCLGAHHGSEEEIVFPFLQQKLDFGGEIEQHKVIHAGLEELLPYIRSAKADASKFDALKLKDMMSKLRDSLFQHLDEEILHLAPENMHVFEAKDIDVMMAKLLAHAHSHDDPFISLPFMLSHTAPEYKVIWPQMPWFVKRVLTPYVFAWRHSGYWKYSPYKC